MDDLISRQAARHALCKAVHKGEDIPCENQTASCLWTGTRVCDYVREIDALPSVQPEQRWIPFRERSPKEGQQILACSEDGVMWMTAYNSQSRFSGAWMPLPEPYRGGEAE